MLQETAVREMRPAARELKFQVPPGIADGVMAWSRARLSPDPHGAGRFGDEYRTTSLYFDTDGFDVYHRKGSFGRSKYRIRRYDAAPVAFLERKLRTKNVLTKRRTAVPLEALGQLSAQTPDPVWAGLWFQHRIEARRLAPTCQITYQRVARIVTTFDGPARLTVDRDVVARQVRAAEFLPDDGGATVVLNGDAIVEIKFLGHPPALFRELVETFALEPFAISKYRLSVEALGRTENSSIGPQHDRKTAAAFNA
jgi:VTC domain